MYNITVIPERERDKFTYEEQKNNMKNKHQDLTEAFIYWPYI